MFYMTPEDVNNSTLAEIYAAYGENPNRFGYEIITGTRTFYTTDKSGNRRFFYDCAEAHWRSAQFQGRPDDGSVAYITEYAEAMVKHDYYNDAREHADYSKQGMIDEFEQHNNAVIASLEAQMTVCNNMNTRLQHMRMGM